jgi:hypothetical protein
MELNEFTKKIESLSGSFPSRIHDAMDTLGKEMIEKIRDELAKKAPRWVQSLPEDKKEDMALTLVKYRDSISYKLETTNSGNTIVRIGIPEEYRGFAKLIEYGSMTEGIPPLPHLRVVKGIAKSSETGKRLGTKIWEKKLW